MLCTIPRRQPQQRLSLRLADAEKQLKGNAVALQVESKQSVTSAVFLHDGHVLASAGMVADSDYGLLSLFGLPPFFLVLAF